jgi:hypothetical protein
VWPPKRARKRWIPEKLIVKEFVENCKGKERNVSPRKRDQNHHTAGNLNVRIAVNGRDRRAGKRRIAIVIRVQVRPQDEPPGNQGLEISGTRMDRNKDDFVIKICNLK